MKKLITMIGAAAMAFGLYADEPAVYDGTSFEAEEAGVSGKTWTTNGLWSTTYEEPFELGEYAGDKYDYGANPRRDGKGTEDNVFPLENKNDNYLKLSTGTNTLTRTVNSKNYYDQVVKFTGFEEAQTNFVEGTKIAIWTSAIEPSGDVAGETNLYVAVGTGDGMDPIKNVKIEVDPNFDFNAWHRITIQNLGEVAQDRAGFLVWIDGIRAEIDDDDSEYFTNEVSEAFKKYYKDDQLFIAMQTGTAVSGVGFAGQGCIDDVAVTAVGPKFTDLTVDVTVVAIPGANIVVKDAAGEKITIDPVSGKYAIPAGDFTVTYTAAQGYKLAGDPVEKKHDTTETTVDDSDTVKPAVVVATKNGTVQYAEDELYGMITGLANGDQVLFNEGATVTNGEDVALYVFSKNTTIDVTVNESAITWDVAVSNETEQTAGSFEDYVGVSAGNTLNVWFETAEDAYMSLNADVAGTLNVEVGTLSVDTVITVAGTIKAAALLISESITLSGAGKVETKVEKDLTGSFDSEEGDVVRTGPQDGWYTYQIDAADYVAQIGDGRTFTTLAEAFDEADATDTVTLLANCELNTQYALTKNITLVLNGKTLSKDVTKSADGKNKMIIVQGGATLTVDGSVEGSTVKGGLYAGVSATSFGTIVANGGSYYPAEGKDDCAFQSNGNAQSGAGNTITITGAKIYSENDIAVYLAGAGTYTITGCTIDAATGIYLKGGALTMTGTTITAKGEFLSALAPDGNGAKSTGDGIVVDAKVGYAGNVSLNLGAGNDVSSENGYAVRDALSDKNETALSALTITEGKYVSGAEKPAVIVADATKTTVSITGGKFGPVAPAANLAPAGYEFALKEGFYELQAKTYTITYQYTLDGTNVTDETGIVNDNPKTFKVTDADITLAPATFGDKVFGGWSQEKIECSQTFEDVTVTGAFTTPKPDFPVDDDDKLDEDGRKAVETAKKVFGDGLNAYVTKVYGEGGKIPAEKLNATTDELIKIAKAYDLPIMTKDVKVETEQTADGFSFKLVDGEDVKVQADKIAQMIKWSADLTSFAVNTDEVGTTLDEDNATIKAEFLKPHDEAKGFMKLELTAPADPE